LCLDVSECDLSRVGCERAGHHRVRVSLDHDGAGAVIGEQRVETLGCLADLVSA
jgi:hypothetical protein